MLRPDLMSALLASIAALFFGLNAFFIRKATVTGRPEEGVLVTLWVNTLIYLAASSFFYSNFSLNMRAFLAFAGSGILASFLARIFYFSSIKKVGASRTIPITRGSTLVASFLSLVFLEEFITKGHLLGILILVFGVVMVSREIERGSRAASLKERWGLIVLPISVMFLRGLAGPLDKIGLSEGGPIYTGLAIKFSIAAVAMTGYFVIRYGSPLTPFRRQERELYVGAGLCSTAALILFYKALTLSRVVVVIPFFSITPLFMLVISYFFLKRLETVTKRLIFATILVVAGAMIIGVFM